jgi:hypothetical protein
VGVKQAKEKYIEDNSGKHKHRENRHYNIL